MAVSTRQASQARAKRCRLSAKVSSKSCAQAVSSLFAHVLPHLKRSTSGVGSTKNEDTCEQGKDKPRSAAVTREARKKRDNEDEVDELEAVGERPKQEPKLVSPLAFALTVLVGVVSLAACLRPIPTIEMVVTFFTFLLRHNMAVRVTAQRRQLAQVRTDTSRASGPVPVAYAVPTTPPNSTPPVATPYVSGSVPLIAAPYNQNEQVPM